MMTEQIYDEHGMVIHFLLSEQLSCSLRFTGKGFLGFLLSLLGLRVLKEKYTLQLAEHHCDWQIDCNM
jgi:hypothetical protein